MVNPMHVKKSKELDDNSPTKNDTSKHIGMQVLYKGFVLKPELLKTQPKESIVQMPQQDNHSKSLPVQPQSRPRNKSPWFGYTEMFYSKSHRDDISAAKLSR